ncbi:uncharacterized protein K02A2.6-like [Ostrea edulis]|uniref:uncharacterized protein K02A2.6-like n=1 Tax=Ostrea edulis TaxID=37623 RepID=UPI0024AF08D1|nr:uncharacterized protein K02A2.6-like [Ostrea edulis]
MSLNKKIANFLLLYRNTPHSVTNETPVKLFHGRNLRTCLDLIRPDTRKIVADKTMKNAMEEREFKENDHVIVRDYRNKDKWINGQIRSKLGPLSYEVTTEQGSVWKRHFDQMRDSKPKPDEQCSLNDPMAEICEQQESVTSDSNTPCSESPASTHIENTPCSESPASTHIENTPCSESPASTHTENTPCSESPASTHTENVTSEQPLNKHYPMRVRKQTKRLIEEC